MSGLALVAHARGAQVSGSDQLEGPYLDRLRRCGIDIHVGHDARNVGDGERVDLVVSSAIPLGNVERQHGRQRHLREYHRTEFLVELVQDQRCIAVAGTHGKTTTSAMIVHALRGAGERVDYIIGGDIISTELNAEWDNSDWVVVETDESDRSLLSISPDIAVLTNVEWDHVDTFDSLGAVEEVFREFLSHAKIAVVQDRPQVRALRRGSCLPVRQPSSQLHSGGSQFTWRGHEVELPVVGQHNVLNAATALEGVHAMGADAVLAAKSMAEFSGVARRFEYLGKTPSGAMLYDDYAHHPSEVAATLEGARTLCPDRLVAVLRPWGLSRTQKMAEAYGDALRLADLVVVLNVAGGTPDFSTQAAAAMLIVDAAVDVMPERPIRRIPEPEAVVKFLGTQLGAGTLCVTLGCRDVADLLLHNQAT